MLHMGYYKNTATYPRFIGNAATFRKKEKADEDQSRRKEQSHFQQSG